MLRSQQALELCMCLSSWYFFDWCSFYGIVNTFTKLTCKTYARFGIMHVCSLCTNRTVQGHNRCLDHMHFLDILTRLFWLRWFLLLCKNVRGIDQYCFLGVGYDVYIFYYYRSQRQRYQQALETKVIWSMTIVRLL